jgi:hypothetical protein
MIHLIQAKAGGITAPLFMQHSNGSRTQWIGSHLRKSRYEVSEALSCMT